MNYILRLLHHQLIMELQERQDFKQNCEPPSLCSIWNNLCIEFIEKGSVMGNKSTAKQTYIHLLMTKIPEKFINRTF